MLPPDRRLVGASGGSACRGRSSPLLGGGGRWFDIPSVLGRARPYNHADGKPELLSGYRSALRLDGQIPTCACTLLSFTSATGTQPAVLRRSTRILCRVDHTFEDGRRWIEVAPPDGMQHRPGARRTRGQHRVFHSQAAIIWFVTEDVTRKYNEWSARGVHFLYSPNVPEWGGIHTRFEDPDGNSFALAGFDDSPGAWNPSGVLSPRNTRPNAALLRKSNRQTGASAPVSSNQPGSQNP